MNAENPAQPAPRSHGCGCGGHGHHHNHGVQGEGQPVTVSPFAGRHVSAGHEMEMPEVRFPSPAVLAMAGEAALRALVRRHHERLRASEIGHLFSPDDAAFTALLERVADFFVEACGGPVGYTPVHGTTCMRTRHLPFTVDEPGREVWLRELLRAMDDTGFPAAAREEYWTWLEAMSVRMINRRTMRAQPTRISFADAVAKLSPPTPSPALAGGETCGSLRSTVTGCGC
jgi:hemoglobin